MKFWKMHGCGNDFIIIDGRFDNKNDDSYSKDALIFCNRKLSIGGDGFIVVKNSECADIKMVYYNADGSRAAMCGNGIRCFAKYVVENIIVNKPIFSIETLNGIKEVRIEMDENFVSSVSVNMGDGCFNPSSIPLHSIYNDKSRFIEENIEIGDMSFKVSSILVGVPHTIVFVDEKLDISDVEHYGNLIENHSIFPEKTNVNFVKIIDKNNIFVQTWERGCGYTYGCGTGMVASAIISNYLDYTTKQVKVSSFGGDVFVKITSKGTIMSGGATKVFSGTTN